MITHRQVRMARAGLYWSASKLAGASGVSLRTVQGIETQSSTGSAATWKALERALSEGDAAGWCEFVGGTGVVLHYPRAIYCRSIGPKGVK